MLDVGVVAEGDYGHLGVGHEDETLCGLGDPLPAINRNCTDFFWQFFLNQNQQKSYERTNEFVPFF